MFIGKELDKLGFVEFIYMVMFLAPSDEGGGKIFDFDGGRDKQNQINSRLSLPQSRIRSTAPSSEGAKENTIKKN